MQENFNKEVMGTPEKTKNNHSGTSVGRFEDSPVFNFMNNSLSPIKPVKPMHITQAINPLTLASLQSVFTYPHATSLNEPRVIHRNQLSYQSRLEFSSYDCNTVNKNNTNVDADNKLDDDREGNLDPTAPTPHELSNEECSDIIAKFLRDSPEHVPEHVTNSYQTSDPAEFSSDELNRVNKNKANVDADNKLDDIIVELFRDSPEHVPEHVTNSYQTSEGNMEGVGIIDQSKVTTPLCSWNDLVSNSSNLSPDPATYFYTSIKPAMQKESKMMESNEKLRVNGGSLIANQFENMDYQHKSGLYRGVRQQRCIVFDKVGPRVTQDNDSSQCVLPAAGIGLHSNAPTATPSYYNIPNKHSSFSRRPLIGPGPFASFHHPPASSGQELVCTTLTESKTDKAENGVAQVEYSCQESGYMENITLTSDIGLHSNAPTANPSYYNIPNRDSSFSRRSLIRPGPFASFHHPRASSGQDPICTTLTKSKTDKAENGVARVEDSCQESGYMENITLSSNIGLHSNAPTATPSYYNIPNKDSSFSRRFGPRPFASFHHPRASSGQEPICTTLTESKTDKAENGVARVEDSCQESGYMENVTLPSDIGLHSNAPTATPSYYNIPNKYSTFSGRPLIGPGQFAIFHHPPASFGQELVCTTLTESKTHKAENGVAQVEDSCQKSGYVKNEGINLSGTNKKRRRWEQAGEGERSCRRCSCKKSKCLKLYCECFAAGVYCVEPCACIDCFNKVVHKEIVLSSRKELESRNPLAFAPKVIMGSISSSEVTDYIRKTPASTRHKRGCNCKKSRCLQKYCECYRGGVGCSINCRCEGCKNEHGTKDGSCALSVGRVKRG